MPRHPGKVVIDGTFKVFGDYVEIYDIDFTDSRTDRYLYTEGIMFDSIGGSIYGCSICDIHTDGVRWSLRVQEKLARISFITMATGNQMAVGMVMPFMASIPWAA